MKARMKKNLLELYEQAMPDELAEARKLFGDAEADETIAFINRIDGQVVDLVFTSGDAFEKNDNNLWLPDCLWDEITE